MVVLPRLSKAGCTSRRVAEEAGILLHCFRESGEQGQGPKGDKAMADYDFDGKTLRNRSGQKMGEIDRASVRAWNGARLGEIDRKNIRDSRGKKVAEFDGKVVKDDLGNKLATIQEIQNTISGEGGINLAAMWYFFVKK